MNIHLCYVGFVLAVNISQALSLSLTLMALIDTTWHLTSLHRLRGCGLMVLGFRVP